LLWAATVLLPPGWHLPLMIAARALSRRRTRTAVTLVAFLAGVLTMTITLTAALSLQGQISSALRANTQFNLVAIGNAANQSKLLRLSSSLPAIQSRTVTVLDTTTPTKINGQPVAAVIGPSPVGGGDRGDRGDRGFLFDGLSGYQLGRGDGPTGLTIVAGRALGRQDAGTNHVLVRSDLLDFPFNLQPGSTIELRESSTSLTRTMQIVGFYTRQRRNRVLGSFFTAPIIGDIGLANALGGGDAETVVTLKVAPDQLTHDSITLQHALPGAFVLNVGDLVAVVETILNELLNLLGVITALVLSAGLAVVANGVALAMFERRREIALFKAIGFGPRNVLQFVLVENALIGALAGTVSVLAAALTLGILSRLAFQRAIGFDPVVAIYILIGAALLAIFTAYLAARTPIRIRPLEALRNE
jgi:ABC-type antimicrobial peptide transport system permease subunit